jgi:hypothetical protein
MFKINRFFSNTLSDGPILVIELIGNDAQGKWLSIIGASGKNQVVLFLIF